MTVKELIEKLSALSSQAQELRVHYADNEYGDVEIETGWFVGTDTGLIFVLGRRGDEPRGS